MCEFQGGIFLFSKHTQWLAVSINILISLFIGIGSYLFSSNAQSPGYQDTKATLIYPHAFKKDYTGYDFRDPRGSGYKSANSGTCNQSSFRLKQTTHELSDLDQVHS